MLALKFYALVTIGQARHTLPGTYRSSEFGYLCFGSLGMKGEIWLAETVKIIKIRNPQL